MLKHRKWVIFILYNFIAVTIIFLIVEGLFSTAIVVYRIYTSVPLAERLHTEHDETLGWINLPNIYVKDMYGTGIYFRTNGQRFRNNNEISLQTQSNKLRIICSGDSFTLGYGVDNDHTWCQQLNSINGRLETVNMGQGGYGIDQAYLWYKRDGSKLNHDIMIFAFITEDFKRMQLEYFAGYGKPMLIFNNGVLQTKNVPVFKPSPFNIRLNRYKPIISNLCSINVLSKLFARRPPVSDNQNDQQTREVALRILQELYKINNSKNSILILLYLPTDEDYFSHKSDHWRQFIHFEASKHGLLFIDMIDEFRKLPLHFVETMFIKEGMVDFHGAKGHYTNEGHLYIAETLYNKLLKIPEVPNKIKQKLIYSER